MRGPEAIHELTGEKRFLSESEGTLETTQSNTHFTEEETEVQRGRGPTQNPGPAGDHAGMAPSPCTASVCHSGYSFPRRKGFVLAGFPELL